jgi:hypothetical protein
MKDIHTERPKAGPIPLVSPAMHCVAMTVLVFLRRSFGYAFLRPKSVFFAFSWAFTLFVIVAWNEPAIWREYRAVCVFGVAAILFYWLHLLRTFLSDINRSGENDHFSGTSHLLSLLESFGLPEDKAELHLHLWIEPAAVAIVASTLRLVASERHLSAWLFLAAACLTASEYLNFWSGTVRREKVAKDMAADAEAQGEQLGGAGAPTAPKATRKEPVKIKRNPER